jgi:predicted RNA-binding Zn ribbon-like protein
VRDLDNASGSGNASASASASASGRGSATTGATTGQWVPSDDGHRWWFDSGSVALDFAYSGAIGDQWEMLHEPADLADWLNGRFPVDGTVTDRDLIDAKALRAAIARLAIAASRNERAATDDVDVVNLFAATPDIPPALAGGGRQAGRARARTGQALSVMAREAVGLFGSDSLPRIRECAADDCAMVFYDDSRSNNRRWCSMQRCGNRAKVRAHRARTS